MTSERDLGEAGLRYVEADRLTIRRRRRGKGFSYRDAHGPLRQAALDRIRRLAIPPAWTDVHISADPAGHLQATGRDQRGRRQYIYHPRFRALQEQAKFEHLLVFGEALPVLRARIESDLAERGHGRDKVLAAIAMP
jgi:DNA topoisomerase-1